MGKFTIVSEEAQGSASAIDQTKASTKAAEERSSSTSDSIDDAFTLRVEQPKRRGRPKGSTNKTVPIIESAAENPADYKLWSQILISSANTVVVTWLGNECAMYTNEAAMMEPPLSRMLARMPSSASQKMATFIDPMVILIALGMWGNRIIKVQRSKKEHDISPEEFMRASGISERPVETQQYSREPSIPSYDSRSVADVEVPLPNQTIAVNPNGVPTAISDQVGDL